jgi:hypothetical protein
MVVAALMLALGAGPTPAFARRSDPKWYQVRTQYQGKQEFLYEIAERFLGDGDRFTEIFTLNKGRMQADGMALTDPEAIEPGWILLLPPDAKGDGVHTGPLPVTTSAPAPTTPTATPALPAASSSAEGGGFPAPLVILLAVGLLIVAGAVTFMLRRRTPRRPSSSDDPATTLTAAADWIIDRALRGMAASAQAAGRPAPPVLGVSLDDSRIRLRLTTPDSAPVEPWRTAAEGRSWIASLSDLQAQPAAGDTPSPYPQLITLGTAGGTRELIDLGRATGVIGIGGDDHAAREVVAGWTEELVSSPWSSRVRVVTGGIVVDVMGGQLTVLDDIPAALDVADALHGETGVLILGGAPDPHRLARLQRPGSGWAVVVLGGTDHDHWHFTAHSGGRLDTGALGLTVSAHRRNQGITPPGAGAPGGGGRRDPRPSRRRAPRAR